MAGGARCRAPDGVPAAPPGPPRRGPATLRDAPGDPQSGPAGPLPDPYWITAEALRQRHLRERRLLVAAAALVAELWQWEGSRAASGGPRPGTCRPRRERPRGLPLMLPPPRRLLRPPPLGCPRSRRPPGPRGVGPYRTPPWSTGCAGKAGAGRRRWPSALSSPPPGAQDGASTAGARRWSCASTFRRARARARVPGPSAAAGPAGWWASCSRGRPSRRRAGGAAPPAPPAPPPALPDQEAGYG